MNFRDGFFDWRIFIVVSLWLMGVVLSKEFVGCVYVWGSFILEVKGVN